MLAEMGADDLYQTDSCTEDGKIGFAPESEIPGSVSCRERLERLNVGVDSGLVGGGQPNTV